MTKPMREYKVLTFDCYGTLIDWETGIWDGLQPLLTENPDRTVSRRTVLEAFAAQEHRLEAEYPGRPYPEILAAAHRSVADQLGLDSSTSLDVAFSQSLPHWPAFPDSAEALRALKKHFRLVILSNVHHDGIVASQRKLGVAFDAVYTAEEIGSYKPNPANFEFMLTRLDSDFGLRKDDVLHTAQSLFHDHRPARALGLATAWIDRQRLSEGGDWGATARLEEIPKTDFLFHSLGDMVDALNAETEAT